MSGICLFQPCFNVFVPELITIVFLQFFVVLVLGPWILKLSGQVRFSFLPKKAIGPKPDRTLKHYFLKPKKCEFCKEKVEWIGMIIQEGKISMDQGKLKGISEWPSPNMVKQTRGFLGFGNFYRRFIRHFSDIARPLNDLLKKDRKFEWTDTCQKAFETLKKCFTEEPVLMMPDHTKPFQIECDTSKYADERGDALHPDFDFFEPFRAYMNFRTVFSAIDHTDSAI
jgi:hypothetical protein